MSIENPGALPELPRETAVKDETVAHNISKEQIKTTCSMIDKTKDIGLALKMYSELLGLVGLESLSDNKDINSSGEKLVKKLFDSKATRQLAEIIKSGVLKLSYFKDFIHRLGSEQQAIIDLIRYSKRIDSGQVSNILYALKFVTDPKLLKGLAADIDNLSGLNAEQKKEIAEYAETIAQALSTEPNIIILSKLVRDKIMPSAGKIMPANKFVVGIKDGKYTIVLSSIAKHQNHNDLFDAADMEEVGWWAPPEERTKMDDVKSGGYLGMKEENEQTMFKMTKSSDKYGFYSQELLEHYRSNIEAALRESLDGKDFTLEITAPSKFE